MKNQYKGGGDCLIRRLGQFVDLMEAWQKIRMGVFIPPNAHYKQSKQSQSNNKLLCKEIAPSYLKE